MHAAWYSLRFNALGRSLKNWIFSFFVLYRLISAPFFFSFHFIYFGNLIMKPTLVLETYKNAINTLFADKKAANESIASVTAKIQGLVKPENFDHYAVVEKLVKATKSVSLSADKVEALAAVGVACPESKLSSTVRGDLKAKTKDYLMACESYAKEVSESKGNLAALELKLKTLKDSAKLAESKRDKGLESFFNEVTSRISHVFGVESPCGRFTAQLKTYALSCKKEDLEKLESSLLFLSNCDSSKDTSAAKGYLGGLELANLSEFVGGLGNPVAAPVEMPDVSAGYDDGTPKPPPTLPAKKKWQEFAREYSGDLVNRDTLADKAFTRLMALGRRVAMHAQRGTLSSIRAAEKSGIVGGRLDSAVMLTISNMHKILQGGINAGVRLAVETSGKDLSILNRVTQSPLIWGENTGFNLADFRAYVEDCLPHLEFKKGVWQMRSKKALENRKLGAFGVYLFGQLPARLVTDKPPLFPMLDWLQFRELKRQFSREAAAANKAAKAEFENAWMEFEESFPLEQQLATVEATLAAIDAERAAIVEKAAKLKAALQ